MNSQLTRTAAERKGMQRRDFLKISVAASGGLLIGFRVSRDQ